MQHIQVESTRKLQVLLAKNTFFANGKNSPIDHLYATAATSRFEVENLFGIYLTKPDFAWMAIWMAVTDRTKLRKRQLSYHVPKEEDWIGALEIGGLDSVNEIRPLLGTSAHVYLFNPSELPTPATDLTSFVSEQAAIAHLVQHGYTWKQIRRRGEERRALMPPEDGSRSLINIDAWQVALVGQERLVPTIDLVLTKSLIDELSSRVQIKKTVPGRNYLVR
ncbi:hypothetical protein CO174_05215 [Candidatus Uhrbacteria bacterium CG_4_9_14_3_um_filter_50_9]|uniref:Uncharacterized protein n=1 Tax=Candidatus Uhrbacteria bacterium CG_4_9_14_3_um_filter_50_9 TaxID=1975035 RepID=A0A2M7XB07_9BACT|nr:MAG: hypothetical protein CO174_05215 [Candidatus Uhrbacteria bacterium CG_4_9_14_3_um_filter_50_9]